MTYDRWHTTWHNDPTKDTPVPGEFLTHAEDTFVSHDNRIAALEAGTTGTGGSVTSVAGRTGVVLLTKNDVGLSNVDNTNDINKPVSTAQTSAINAGDALSVPKSLITTKGDLLVGDASGNVVKLPSSSIADGYVLTKNAAQSSGLLWAAQTGGGGGGSSVPLSTVTTKGDLIVATASGVVTRQGVGADGLVLTANTGSSTGMNWTLPSWIPLSTVSSTGDLIVASGPGAVSRLPSNINDGDVLTVNSSLSLGMEWSTPAKYIDTIYDETFLLTKRPAISFVGPAVNATDDSGNLRTKVTINETNPVPSDHNLAGWTFPTYVCGSGQSMTSGLLYLAKVKIPFATTITKIYWLVVTSAVGATASQNEVGVYNSSGSRQATITSTTDSGSANQTLITSTISSITVNPPYIWIGFVFNAATTPVTIGRSNSAFVNVFNAGLTASTYDFATNVASQTSLPSSVTLTSNIAGPALWAGIAV